MGPSKLVYASDQCFCPVGHLLWVAGGIGSRPELGSRSSGHALIPNDADDSLRRVAGVVEYSRRERETGVGKDNGWERRNGWLYRRRW